MSYIACDLSDPCTSEKSPWFGVADGVETNFEDADLQVDQASESWSLKLFIEERKVHCSECK